ncbi:MULTISPECIES: cobalamin B12-binding domain-containing protein [Methanothermobacter]|nr:cobalamin-dependent protein [Methanothermobacter wolfeii]UXH32246.1 cobalamin-dependent protein [Methanothermobacter wolfeii]
MVSETEPEVLAISATMTFNIGHVKEIIDKVRELDPEPAVMVGGYPFNIDTSLWKKVGADMHAVNASGAVKVAEEFLEVG